MLKSVQMRVQKVSKRNQMHLQPNELDSNSFPFQRVAIVAFIRGLSDIGTAQCIFE